MNKKDIQLKDALYWNTTGAFNSNVSLKCEVVDIGKKYIWVYVIGNLAYNNLLASNLSRKPLHKVTNERNNRYE